MRHRSSHTVVLALTVFVACAIAAQTCLAATFNVPSALYPTIQSGINGSTHGDVIMVADGTYAGVGNRNVTFGGRNITVRSANGPDACIIDCGGIARGFIFSSGETANALLEGFTITNADTTDSGGAILCSNSSPTIKNCKITGNEASLVGAGLAFSVSSATVVNCTITGNESVFANGGGVAFAANSDVTMINCTITGNKADVGSGGALYALDSNPTFINCIIWNNSPDETALGGSSAPTLNYCDLQGGWGGAGSHNINEDPLFTDPGGWAGSTWVEGNYLILPASPCIDSGFGDNGATVLNTDIEGNARYDDPAVTNTGGGTPDYVDMGAYERQAAPPDEVSYDDILWRNATTGEVGIWLMNGLTVTTGGVVETVNPASGWAIKGVGDFDGDDKADVLWREGTTGEVAIWLMNGLTISNVGSLGTVNPASGWAIKGVGDFNGNGKADILWRDATMGEVAVWLMNGVSVGASGIPATVDPASGWAIKGVGDFNGNGKADILWRDATSGDVGIWLMNGLTLTIGDVVATIAPALGWAIKGVGDFNGDGKADVLWRNGTSGDVGIWLMNGLTITASGVPGTVNPALTWAIKGTGDFNGVE